MGAKRAAVLTVVLLGAVACCLSCGGGSKGDGGGDEAEAPAYAPLDSLGQKVLFAYIREHFDDIHDVTMRYHHKDHNINGRVVIQMVWEGGVVKSAEAVANETGDDSLPASLIEKIRGWKIEELEGPSRVTLPFNVQLVGRDDPEFPNTGILTGEVTDAGGEPLPGALILIKPEVAGLVYRAETNREGIFVRTLIPSGTWDVECSLTGYGTETRTGLEISAGDHKRETFVLKRK